MGVVTIVTLVLLRTLMLPVWLVVDTCRVVVWMLALFIQMMRWGSEQQMDVLDQHCISWALRTSLDGPVRIATLSYLATMALVNLNPTIVTDCFDILFGCVKVIEGKATVTQGMDELAAASALCCLHTLSHLKIVDPKSRVIRNTRERYQRIFQRQVNVNGPLHSPALGLIHGIFYNMHYNALSGAHWPWGDYNPSNNEYAIFTRALAMIVQSKSRQSKNEKVPRWLLRFALHSLSPSPLPASSVAASCLSILAIDMGCDLQTTEIFDERFVNI